MAFIYGYDCVEDSMNKLKENFELFAVILAIVVIIVFFFSLFIQIPVLVNAIQYERELGFIDHLTEDEMEEICLGEPCNYSHKICFDNQEIKVSNSGIQITDKVWVYYRTFLGKKVYVDRSYFLHFYLLFDVSSFVFLTIFYFYMKKEKAKENPNANKKLDRLLKKKTASNMEDSGEEDKPLPPFSFVYFLGYLQFAICFIASYYLAKNFSGYEWSFLVSFTLPFITGALFFFTTKRSIAFFLTSLLCLVPAATGKDILYIDKLLPSNSQARNENVFTLPEGGLKREYTGSYVQVITSGNKNRNRSYFYHFVAPYKINTEPFSQWIVLKQEWMEDETKFNLFWNAWKEKRLVVQIDDEKTMYAITKAANRHQLNLSQGVALLKPILSIETEIETTFWNVFWTDGIALLIWTGIGIFRLYAGRKTS